MGAPGEIRTLKKHTVPNRVLRDWTDSEVMNGISINGEVLFVRLIMKVDDFGCFSANPKLIKAALFPLRDIREADISRWLDEIHKAGLIVLYGEAGKKYLYIKNFNQRLRAMKRKYPQPGSNPPSDDGHLSDRNETETNPNPETESETETNPAEADFADFIAEFNLITGRAFKGGKKERQAFRSRIRDGFTSAQIERAVFNCFNDAWHQQNPNYLTPEFILRPDKLEKYLNYVIPINNGGQTSTSGQGKFTSKAEQASRRNADQLREIFGDPTGHPATG